MPMFFGLFGVFWVAGMVLWIWALVDVLRVPDDSLFRSGDKLIWVLVIVLTNFIGAIVYLAIGRPQDGPRLRSAADPRSLPPPPPPA